jgi:hypothetical protein
MLRKDKKSVTTGSKKITKQNNRYFFTSIGQAFYEQAKKQSFSTTNWLFASSTRVFTWSEVPKAHGCQHLTLLHQFNR